MEQINRIELRGVVGSVRLQSISGRKVARINLVTNYVYKSKDGDPVIESTWHQISAWEGKEIVDLDNIVKGTKLQASGRLRSQRYTDSEGIERTSYEVLANKLQIINPEEFLQCGF